MARNNTRDELVEMVLDECRHSTDATRGVDNRNYIIRLVKNYYESLYSEHDWPFARIKKEDAGKDIAAGQRYYDYPAELDLERGYALWVKWGTPWLELKYGIGPEQYSAFDSDTDMRTDPPLRWQIYQENQFEIWPLPATDQTNGLRFEGYRKMTPLTTGGSRCDLDGILVAKFVAARVLARKKTSDGQLVLAEAQQRLATLTNREPKARVIMSGAHMPNKQQYRVIGGRMAKVEG